MRQKAQLDARLQFAQNRLRAGQMNQAQYQQTFAQYQTLIRNVMSRWSALPEAARKKAQEIWNEELKKQQNAQAGQNGQPSTPAPAAEQPSTPAPAAEQPQSEGAPSAALERSQTVWTEA